MEGNARTLSRCVIYRRFILKIFVTLGSSSQNFNRLLIEIDSLILKKVINVKDIVVQSNSNDYIPKNYNLISNLSLMDYNNYLKNCDILITHGGVGSITDGLFNNKKVISFPRLKIYHEAVNDHQKQIVDKFYNDGYILTGEIKNLDNLIKNIDKFNPNNYKSNNKDFNDRLINIIDKL